TASARSFCSCTKRYVSVGIGSVGPSGRFRPAVDPHKAAPGRGGVLAVTPGTAPAKSEDNEDDGGACGGTAAKWDIRGDCIRSRSLRAFLPRARRGGTAVRGAQGR